MIISTLVSRATHWRAARVLWRGGSLSSRRAGQPRGGPLQGPRQPPASKPRPICLRAPLPPPSSPLQAPSAGSTWTTRCLASGSSTMRVRSPTSQRCARRTTCGWAGCPASRRCWWRTRWARSGAGRGSGHCQVVVLKEALPCRSLGRILGGLTLLRAPTRPSAGGGSGTVPAHVPVHPVVGRPGR
jgi:hypothetical protein